jgi:radical SAM protein with 4Fe4S-binding SPASM domain
VLFVDVTDAIHLNPAAAFLVQLALDDIAPRQTAMLFRRQFHGVSREEAQRQTKKVYAIVHHLKNTAAVCPLCDLVATHKRLPGDATMPVVMQPVFSLSASAPYKADLALSYGCNNACSHCYNESRGSHLSKHNVNDAPPLLPAEWHRVLERLAEIGIPHVIFTGGEPTLHDTLPDLIRAAVRLGLVTGLNTNGRQLCDRRFAESLRDAGLDHVQITLESFRPEIHNAMTGATAFAETLFGLQNALSVGLHTLTNTTLTQRNIDHAGPMVVFLHELGLSTFAMNGIIHAGSGRNHADAVPVEALPPVLADVRDRAISLGMRFLWYTPTEYCRLSPVEWELGPRRCNAGEYSICIEPNGDVLPCQSYYVSAGNILHDDWQQIWQSELFRGFRRRTTDPQGCGLPERCWTCPDLTLCAGGCRLERMKNGC